MYLCLFPIISMISLHIYVFKIISYFFLDLFCSFTLLLVKNGSGAVRVIFHLANVTVKHLP